MQFDPLKRMAAILVGVGVGLCAASASAAPVTSFTSAPVTDTNATTDDPNLIGKIRNLMIVNTGGNDWTNSLIRIQLTQGQVYNASNAAGTDAQPNAGIWGIPTLRNGPFDTFVNSKGTGANPNDAPTAATILGIVNPDGTPGQPQLPPLPPAIGLTPATPPAITQLVSVQWGNTIAGDTGTFSVGRFTLSADAVGTFFGSSFDSSGAGAGVPFSGNIVAGVMVVPEPTSLGLLGLIGFGALARRRRGYVA